MMNYFARAVSSEVPQKLAITELVLKSLNQCQGNMSSICQTEIVNLVEPEKAEISDELYVM